MPKFIKILITLILVVLFISCAENNTKETVTDIPVFEVQNELSLQKKIAVLESDAVQLETPDKLLQLGKLYYQLAIAENGDAFLEPAEEYLNKAFEMKPDNAEARAYLGSLFTLKAKYSYLPWKKLQFVEEGCNYLDQAVASDSLNADIRIIRATNNVHLPEFFNRLKVSERDLAYLRSDSVFSGLSPSDQSKVLYYSGILYEKLKRNEQAVEMYQRFIKTSAKEDSHQKMALRKIEELSKQG